jgi:hypothetical protein
VRNQEESAKEISLIVFGIYARPAKRIAGVCSPVSKSEKLSDPPSKRRARQLRIIGVTVLVMGFVAAGFVYWLGTRGPDLNNDPSMQGFNRAEQRQMGQLYGKSGLLIDEWSDDLKQPGTQAILILIFSGLSAVGCLYFARLMDVDDEAG